MISNRDNRRKGFTLAELLIVVAIIAVLVAISIPIFSSQLEKSRDAVTVANIRAAYAEAQTQYITCEFTDNNMDGGVHSHAIVDANKKTTMTVNFKNGHIYQICVMNVTIKSKKRNDYSGLASNLPFYNVLTADAGVAGTSPYVVFQYAADGTLEKVQVITPKPSK